MNTLTDRLDPLITVNLPDDCLFTNEFDTAEVRQTTTRTIGGKFIYQRGKMYKGRSIVLSGDFDSAWVTRTTALMLKSMYDNATGKYNLHFGGVDYVVVFDYTDDSPFESKPIIPCADPDGDAWYTFKIKLLTVEI